MLSLFDVTINLFESILLSIFVTNLLFFSKNNKVKCLVLIAIVFFLEVSLANILFLFEDHYWLVYFISIVLISKLFSKSSLQDIMIMTLLGLLLISFSNVVALFIMSGITENSVFVIINENRSLFEIAIIISKIVFLISQVIISKAFIKIFIESAKYFKEFFAILFVGRLCLITLESMLFTGVVKEGEIFVAIIQETIMISFIVYIYYRVQFDNKLTLSKLKKYNDMSSYREHFESIKKYNDNISIINHDLKNSLTILEMYITDGKNKSALDFIHKKFDVVSNVKYLVDSQVDIIDLVINRKKQIAETKDIDMDININSNTAPNIDDFEFGCLLGNVIDNAIEHCGSKRKIKIVINNFGDNIIIKVMNSIDDSIKLKNPKFETTKEDKDFHGLGIISMKDTVEKYKGTIDFTEENNYFICSIMIPN